MSAVRVTIPTVTSRTPTGKNWPAWHDDYADPTSALSQRLAIVQSNIRAWLDARPDDDLRVVSACAGQGHDLLGVLAERADAARVRASLLEFDRINVDLARATVTRLELERVEIRCADAGALTSYLGAVPADLVLFAGIFGNISEADIERSVHALPQLCAPGATVIWTRTRTPPDVTPTVRRWFDEAGFDEVAFAAPPGTLASVGVHRLRADPQPLGTARIFEFLEVGTATRSG